MTSPCTILVALLAITALAGAQTQFGTDPLAVLAVNSTNFEDTEFRIKPPSEYYLRVYALPVGQGDCTIIQCPKPSGNIVVVDCGSAHGHHRFSAEEVRQFLGNEISKVVAIFISHPDKDHYSYLYQIIWKKNIKSIIIGGQMKDYKGGKINKRRIYSWLKKYKKDNKLYTLNYGGPCIGYEDSFNNEHMHLLDFCNNEKIKFKILAANVVNDHSKKNGLSIVLKVVANRWSMLLPGDIEGEAATDIAKNKNVRQELKSTVYKMAHHGASDKANRKDWLEQLNPKQAFASSAYKGSYYHPRCDTIKRLLELDTIIETDPHLFYCWNEVGEFPGYHDVVYYNFPYHMLETSPTENKRCLLEYLSNGNAHSDCEDHTGQPLPIEEVEDEVSEGDGGNQCDLGEEDFEEDFEERKEENKPLCRLTMAN